MHFFGEYLISQPRLGVEIVYPLIISKNATKTNTSFRFRLHANVTNKYGLGAAQIRRVALMQHSCGRIAGA